MEKSTVYLTEAQKAALARTAAAEGRSEATLIRAGIDIVTARHRVGEVTAPYEAALEVTAEPAGLPPRPRWISREVFVQEFLAQLADAGLLAELKALAPETTDDEPIP
jgi:hypothetical protein